MRTPGRKTRLFLISAAFVATNMAAATAQERLYRLIELRGESGRSTKAYALNNTGQIVGWLEFDDDTRHSAHWHVDTSTDLHGTVHFELLHPIFDVGYSEAYDISNADQIVGTGRTEIECIGSTVLVTNAYLLRPAVLTDLASPYAGDALTNLGTLGSPCALGYDSAATGVSNANHVVGWADNNEGATRAVLTIPVNGQFYRDEDPNDFVNDLIIDLGTFRGDTDPVSAATAVNDDGVITGYSYTVAIPAGADGPRAAYHAFLIAPNDTDGDGLGDEWYLDAAGGNALMQDLGTLGGFNSWGRDINNHNQVVGESDTDPDESGGYNLTRAFLWEDGNVTDLGALANDSFSAASAINDNGVIVGWAGDQDGERRAFIYEDGEMHDLNDLICLRSEDGLTTVPGITLTEARDINEDGWIVGWGDVRTSGGADTRGFLLIPVDPEDCEVEEEEDGEPTDSEDPGGSGTGGAGAAIVGTPANLTAGTDGDEDASDGAGAAGLAGLCGFGTATVMPLMLAGLWLMRTGAGRRLRRAG